MQSRRAPLLPYPWAALRQESSHPPGPEARGSMQHCRGCNPILDGPVVETDLLMQTTMKNKTLQVPAKLYRIGELVQYTPFSRQTIHNYTIMGLISEAQWTEGGHRLYDESVFERLSTIINLKRTNTLSEIREIMSRESVTAQVSRLTRTAKSARRSPGATQNRQDRPPDITDRPATRTNQVGP